MTSKFKIKLYLVADENSLPEILNPLFCHISDSYADLQSRLEKGECVEWPFQFWDFEEHCRIREKFEVTNPVCERVYVIPAEEEGALRLQKQVKVGDVVEIGSNEVLAPTDLGLSPLVNVDEFGNVAPTFFEDAIEASLDNAAEAPREDGFFLQSKLISDESLGSYKRASMKLKRELLDMDFADHA